MAKAITDRPLYIFTKYLYAFLVTNFYFVVSNLLFFIAYFLADFTFENILLYYITLIPMGPSLTAVFFTMGKLVREREVSPTPEYWKAYKNSFGTSFKYWFIQLTIMFIIMVDIYYSTSNVNILSPLYLVLLVFSLLVMMYAFPIIARFEVKIRNLIIISVYSIFRFFKSTLLNTTSIIAFGVIFFYLPSISSLFFISLIAFFVMYNLQDPLLQMEKEMSENE